MQPQNRGHSQVPGEEILRSVNIPLVGKIDEYFAFGMGGMY